MVYSRMVENDGGLSQQAAQIYQELLGRRSEHQIEPTLDRVKTVLDMLGDPQHLYHSVHITGTNGKTSTARMCVSLLESLGYRTGLFTSPHLSKVTERICVDGSPISDDDFVRAWQDVVAYIELVDQEALKKNGVKLSFFEALVVTALAYFADVPVTSAVIEVGMGGQWDATNVIDASCSIIMPISREHEQWLGKGLTSIAKEKAGIIKPRATVIVAGQEEEVLEIIFDKAREVDATVRLEGEDFKVLQRQVAVGGQLLSIQTSAASYNDIFLPLFGAHQGQNAACALAAVEAMVGGRPLHGPSVESGFAKASSPGRLEILRSSPMIVADSGHNPGACQVLAKALKEDLGWDYAVGVYSAMGDKDIETVLSIMEPVLDELVITDMSIERGVDFAHLRDLANEVFGPDRVNCHPDLVQAIDAGSALVDATELPAGTAGTIVFGSVVLAGMARDLLKSSNR